MKKYFLIALIFLLTSCSPGVSTSATSAVTENLASTPVDNIENAYPVIIETAYPIEMPNPDTSIQTEPSASGTGTLTGTILLNGRPVVNVNLFLAQTLTNSEGAEIVAEMDVVTSPRSFTNSAGEFIITNIKPGRYALILDIAVKSFLLTFPDNQETILMTIEPDLIIELGVLDFTELPIPDSYVK
ncbi:MAG: hypothetical protein JW987_06045 [Anaerolineaceae bacterium]|nr:hypothetical protein [Anaerolineaceae bacterium]